MRRKYVRHTLFLSLSGTEVRAMTAKLSGKFTLTKIVQLAASD